jgi:hypothetical protein
MCFVEICIGILQACNVERGRNCGNICQNRGERLVFSHTYKEGLCLYAVEMRANNFAGLCMFVCVCVRECVRMRVCVKA